MMLVTRPAKTSLECREAAGYRTSLSSGNAIDRHLDPGLFRRLLGLVASIGAKLLQEIDCRLRDGRAGAEDGPGAGLIKCRVVLRRDDAADHHHDVTAAKRFERLAQGGHERQVACGKR